MKVSEPWNYVYGSR